MKNFTTTIFLVFVVLCISACSYQEEMSTDDENHSHGAENQIPTESVDLQQFFDAALIGDAQVESCVLSNGVETSCYALTIAGYPSNHDVGPFCPSSTTTPADEAGIWFDGNDVYDADGEFILSLAALYQDDNWKLYNDDGSVRVTNTPEAFKAAARPDVAPEYQNYCVEGRIEWLSGGEPVQQTVLIPIEPTILDNPSSHRGNLGVTLNGVIIAAPAPVHAILGAYTIATFDDCGGHVNPIEGYHLHGALGCSERDVSVENDPPIFAYAMDGIAIHSPFATDAEKASANLDLCNGHSSQQDGYHYHANAAKDNAVIPCLVGAAVQEEKTRR